jgi:hypothetical protein
MKQPFILSDINNYKIYDFKDVSFKTYLLKNDIFKLTAKRYVDFLFSEDRIKRKLVSKCLELCKTENIDVVFYENSLKLNDAYQLRIKDSDEVFEPISGCYCYTILKKDGRVIYNPYQKPEIWLNKESNSLVYTFLHELGHYYALIKNDDGSEEGANSYILPLVKGLLNDFEFKLLEITLHIYSNYKIFYDKSEFDSSDVELKYLVNMSEYITSESNSKCMFIYNATKELKKRFRKSEPSFIVKVINIVNTWLHKTTKPEQKLEVSFG